MGINRVLAVDLEMVPSDKVVFKPSLDGMSLPSGKYLLIFEPSGEPNRSPYPVLSVPYTVGFEKTDLLLIPEGRLQRPWELRKDDSLYRWGDFYKDLYQQAQYIKKGRLIDIGMSGKLTFDDGEVSHDFPRGFPLLKLNGREFPKEQRAPLENMARIQIGNGPEIINIFYINGENSFRNLQRT